MPDTPRSETLTAGPIWTPDLLADLHDPRLILTAGYVGRDRRRVVHGTDTALSARSAGAPPGSRPPGPLPLTRGPVRSAAGQSGAWIGKHGSATRRVWEILIVVAIIVATVASLALIGSHASAEAGSTTKVTGEDGRAPRGDRLVRRRWRADGSVGRSTPDPLGGVPGKAPRRSLERSRCPPDRVPPERLRHRVLGALAGSGGVLAGRGRSPASRRVEARSRRNVAAARGEAATARRPARLLRGTRCRPDSGSVRPELGIRSRALTRPRPAPGRRLAWGFWKGAARTLQIVRKSADLPLWSQR